MEPFRSVRGGGAPAWLAAAEASLLRSLVGQVMALVEPEDYDDPRPGEDAELAALEGWSRARGPTRHPRTRCWPGCCRTATATIRRRPGSSASTPSPRCAAPSTPRPGRCWTRC